MNRQVVNALREQFVQCPGCLRDRYRIWRERPFESMDWNQCLTVEHIVPQSRGGDNRPDNLMIVCHRCNFTRGSQVPWDWNGAQRGVYSDGWPCPPIFFGRNGRGRQSRLLWENRARAIAALLGFGPFDMDESLVERDLAMRA